MEHEPTIFCLDCGYPVDGLATHRCPECGRLFDPDDPASVAHHRCELVKLYVSGEPMDVYMLRDMLIEEGMPATVIGERLLAARGELPVTADTLPAVWVGRRDADRAAALAREFDQRKRQRAAATDAWTCPSCGEEVEAQFSACWNCGADRPQA